jgi:hypothetical protein
MVGVHFPLLLGDTVALWKAGCSVDGCGWVSTAGGDPYVWSNEISGGARVGVGTRCLIEGKARCR